MLFSPRISMISTNAARSTLPKCSAEFAVAVVFGPDGLLARIDEAGGDHQFGGILDRHVEFDHIFLGQEKKETRRRVRCGGQENRQEFIAGLGLGGYLALGRGRNETDGPYALAGILQQARLLEAAFRLGKDRFGNL